MTRDLLNLEIYPSLTTHKQSHTGSMPHKCDMCDKGFCQSGHITIHTGSHTGVNLYKSYICDKGYSSKKNINNQIQLYST